MKKAILGILIILLLTAPAFAVDLGDFPHFILDDVRLVIGRAADAEDVIGAIDIVASLQQLVGRNKRLQGAIFDTEVEALESQNTIIVGGPCINAAAARIMGFPKNCLEGFELGKGLIKLYEFDNGNYALLAAGTTALDTRRVTTVLANYDEYSMEGTEMVVMGLVTSDIDIKIK